MANRAYPLKEAFVQSLSTNYFAQATNEDFLKGVEVMNKLNSWVSEKTFGKIDEILSEPPTPQTILMLINTVYFKGKWVEPFNKGTTFDETFNNSDGTTSKIRMMSIRNKNRNYLHNSVDKFKVN